MIEIKYGKRRVINYRGARKVVGGLTVKNKIEILLYLSKELASLSSEAELADKVITLCGEIFEPDNVTFRVWNPARESLEPRKVLKVTTPPRRELASGEGFSGRVFEAGESMLITDLARHPELLDRFETTLTAACVIIASKDGPLGTLSIEKDIAYFYKEDDMEILEAMAAQLGLALNEVRLVSGLMEARERHESDLKMGRDVQSQIVPAGRIPAWNGIYFDHYYEPMVEVSGDYYDVVRKASTITCLIVDVSGHGVPAALVTMTIHYHFRRCVQMGFSLSEILEELGEALRPKLPDGTYFTAQIVRIHGDHTFSFVNAGHQKLVQWSFANRNYQEIDSTGFPLGFLPARKEDYKEVTGRLAPGDLLLMMTDGFTEQRNPDGQETGLRNMMNWVLEEIENAGSKGEDVKVDRLMPAILNRWRNHVAGVAMDDDLTMLMLQCSPGREKALSLHERALAAYGEGETGRARDLALRAYDVEPSLNDNLMFLARIFYRAAAFTESARYLREFIEATDGESPQVHYRLGYVLYKSDEFNEAGRHFKKCLALDHANPDASLMLAKCYLKDKRPDKAERALERGLRVNPGNELLSMSLNRVRKARGQDG